MTEPQPNETPPPAAPAAPPADPPKIDPPAEPAPQEPAPAVAGAPPTSAAPPPPADGLAEARAECRKFLDAFGAKGGEWFAAGKTFAEAQALHAQDLAAENEALKSRLAALDRGEKAPVTFQPEQRDDARAKRRADLKNKVGENLAAFAAEIDCAKQKEGN